MTSGPSTVLADREISEISRSGGSRFRYALTRNPAFWIGATGVVLIVAAAVFAPLLTNHNPDFAFREEGLTAAGDPVGPNALFPLGTDELGRDYLSRLLYGARISLTVGIAANLIAVLIGVAVGSVAGFVGSPQIRLRFGRRRLDVRVPVENILMRFTDAVLSFPVLLLAIALVAVVRPSLGLVVGVIAGVLWTPIARVVYSRALVVREAEFILAARAVGVGPVRILVRHVMPHLFSLIAVYATLGIASTIQFEATLSFLGVGVPVPAPSWGGMIFEHIGYYATDPRVVILPGLAIMATILAFNLLGDALADAFDPFRWR